ncbi:hypothetical protein C1H46_027094 [Malus baccata]|uniref:Uncharacterized protein n=1 Tax=Malus baccata TaxID=106549 RepID=A0A540LLP1_MALBA|nr:hypothetical protein C1H46_027094 [Malus baccata]
MEKFLCCLFGGRFCSQATQEMCERIHWTCETTMPTKIKELLLMSRRPGSRETHAGFQSQMQVKH